MEDNGICFISDVVKELLVVSDNSHSTFIKASVKRGDRESEAFNSSLGMKPHVDYREVHTRETTTK